MSTHGGRALCGTDWGAWCCAEGDRVNCTVLFRRDRALLGQLERAVGTECRHSRVDVHTSLSAVWGHTCGRLCRRTSYVRSTDSLADTDRPLSSLTSASGSA